MKNEKDTCQGCYWEDSCGCETACDDYTPINSEESDIAFYNGVLCENIQEYDDIVREQNS